MGIHANKPITISIAILTITIMMALSVTSCSYYAYTNTQADNQNRDDMKLPKAMFKIKEDRGSFNKALVILALSGGGSRSAYWSASLMLKLSEVFKNQDLDILKEVDAISCVSGGTMPAAYYVVSRDSDDQSGQDFSNRVWDEKTVKELMSKNYRDEWFRNWFWPTNIIKYWFTAYDRTDIMAQVFSDNFLSHKETGVALKFKDFNKKRPYIIINATNATHDYFGDIFTFTVDNFQKINADLSDYEIARAIMASSTFPGVFNFMTLKNYAISTASASRYLHLFDGGNVDNLGVESVKHLIQDNKDDYDKIIVMILDAYVESKGSSDQEYDERKLSDYVIDSNLIDSFDSLLKNSRYSKIDSLRDLMKGKEYQNKMMFLYHIKFQNLRDKNLTKRLNSIATDFKIDDDGVKAIDEAVSKLMVKDNECLSLIRDILIIDKDQINMEFIRKLYPNLVGAYPYCTWDF